VRGHTCLLYKKKRMEFFFLLALIGLRCLYSLVFLTWVVQWLRLALSKGPNRVGVSPSPEDGNRSSFRNVVFF
jgi:hypothetical protein